MAASDAELLRITQFYIACMVAVGYWDWLVSLTKEYRVIWKADWSLVKVLYLVARYWCLAAGSFSLWVFTESFEHSNCQKLVHTVAAINSVTVLCVEMVLAIRTYAIWGRPRWLLGVIILCLGLELGSKLAGSISARPLFPPGMPAPCVWRSGSAANYFYFISPFFVDTILTALCSYKAFQISRVGEPTSLLKVFVRDGLLYFCVVALANLVQTGFVIQPRSAMKAINAAAAIALSSIMCCRLILSLKMVNEQQELASLEGSHVGRGSQSAFEMQRRSVHRNRQSFPVNVMIKHVTDVDDGDVEKAMRL